MVYLYVAIMCLLWSGEMCTRCLSCASYDKMRIWQSLGAVRLWFRFNSYSCRQNGRHFADDTFKRNLVNETVRISIKISPKLVPKGPINTTPTLIQIMALCRPHGKPSSEPVMVKLLYYNGLTLTQHETQSQGDMKLFASLTSWNGKVTLSHALYWMELLIMARIKWNLYWYTTGSCLRPYDCLWIGNW